MKKLLMELNYGWVHQTYTRANLWMQICDKLKIPYYRIPKELGEDGLARFGAYREDE